MAGRLLQRVDKYLDELSLHDDVCFESYTALMERRSLQATGYPTNNVQAGNDADAVTAMPTVVARAAGLRISTLASPWATCA